MNLFLRFEYRRIAIQALGWGGRYLFHKTFILDLEQCSMAKTKSYIITFKPKDKRADKKSDKADLFRSIVKEPLNVVDVLSTARMPFPMTEENMVLDINEYEMPIMTAPLSEQEHAAVRRNPNVQKVEPDGRCFALSDNSVSFPSLGFRPLFPSTTIPISIPPQAAELQSIPWGIERVKAPQAWDISRGKGIKVAVVDTGIDYTHPDISPNYRGGISFVPTETDPKDYNRHGTHVAGTIAAADNGTGVIGIAPSAYLYAVKVLSSGGSGNWSWLIAGIAWCVRMGMHVLNMSLGASTAPDAVGRMCDYAWRNGLILVAAAGNTGLTPNKDVGFPAQYPSVIAVSAIDSSDVIAPFSSRGQKVELSAPGVNIMSTIPGNTYGNLNGTSMASPHVAGGAALALSTHRWAPPETAHNVAIRRLLAATADNLGNPGHDPLFGFGRINVEEAAFSLSVPPAIPGIP
jgi:subtilisin